MWLQPLFLRLLIDGVRMKSTIAREELAEKLLKLLKLSRVDLGPVSLLSQILIYSQNGVRQIVTSYACILTGRRQSILSREYRCILIGLFSKTISIKSSSCAASPRNLAVDFAPISHLGHAIGVAQYLLLQGALKETR